MRSTTVLLVDDHPLVREGLRGILHHEGDFAVVGQAGGAQDAVIAAAKHRPDVVLLDVEIPGGDVVSTVRALKAVSPASRIVVVSMYDSPPVIRELLGLGIRGYLVKSVPCEELIAAIRTALTDAAAVVLAISRESLAQVQEGGSSPLSDREREVLNLVAQALSNAQVGSRLGLSESTVKRHLRNIFLKLGAVSRIDAVNKAIDACLIPSGAQARRW